MAISLHYNSNSSCLDYYASLQLTDLFLSSPLPYILQIAAKMIFLKWMYTYAILLLKALQSLPNTLN